MITNVFLVFQNLNDLQCLQNDILICHEYFSSLKISWKYQKVQHGDTLGHVQIFNSRIWISSHPLSSCDHNEKEWKFEMMSRTQQWYSLTKIKGLDNEQ